jgi:hypothetical protein
MYMHQKLDWLLRIHSRQSNLSANWKKKDEHTTHTIIREVENALKVSRSSRSSYTPTSNLVLLQRILTMKMAVDWMGDTHKQSGDWWERASKGSICCLGWKKVVVESDERDRCYTKIWECIKFLGFLFLFFDALNGWQRSGWKKGWMSNK